MKVRLKAVQALLMAHPELPGRILIYRWGCDHRGDWWEWRSDFAVWERMPMPEVPKKRNQQHT